jgi:hypothetical protein
MTTSYLNETTPMNVLELCTHDEMKRVIKTIDLK